MKLPVEVDVLPVKEAEHYACAICASTFQHPVYLTCGHTFCAKCIARLLAGAKWMNRWTPGNPEDRACPNCRSPLIKLDFDNTDGQHIRDLWLKVDPTPERSGWVGFIHGSGLLLANQLRDFNRGGNTASWSRKTLGIVEKIQEGIESYEKAILKASSKARVANRKSNSKSWWDVFPFNLVNMRYTYPRLNWTTWTLITTGLTIGISSSPQLDIPVKKKTRRTR